MNIATSLYPLDDARMSGFVERLDAVNALADASPGFVWRLQSDNGNATDIQVTDDPRLIINMSVWENAESLFAFVYRTVHAKVMARRRDWFEKPTEAYQVLWWVSAGHIPTPEEGLARISLVQRTGPTADAFTFVHRYPPPDGDGPVEDMKPEPWCVGWS